MPDLNEPLLSVAGLADDGLVSVFDGTGVSFYRQSTFEPHPSPVAVGERRGNLYYLPDEVSTFSVSVSPTQVNKSLYDWHHIFNHIGVKPLKSLLKSLNVNPTELDEVKVQQCPVCV